MDSDKMMAEKTSAPLPAADAITKFGCGALHAIAANVVDLFRTLPHSAHLRAPLIANLLRGLPADCAAQIALVAASTVYFARARFPLDKLGDLGAKYPSGVHRQSVGPWQFPHLDRRFRTVRRRRRSRVPGLSGARPRWSEAGHLLRAAGAVLSAGTHAVSLRPHAAHLRIRHVCGRVSVAVRVRSDGRLPTAAQVSHSLTFQGSATRQRHGRCAQGPPFAGYHASTESTNSYATRGSRHRRAASQPFP